MQRTASAWSRLSTLAASFLVASVVTAAGEPNVIELDDYKIEAPASGMTLAALDPIVLDTNKATPEGTAPDAEARIVLSAADSIVGIASFYDYPQKTASGEEYDPTAFTAAAQLAIRDRFGGIRFGRLYQPAYGLGEYGGKKIIVRFNDVGPLRPGRKFDLSRAAMAYFDNTLDKGLLPNFKVTPLPLGRAYVEGPITDQQLTALGIAEDVTAAVCTDVVQPLHAIQTGGIAQAKPPVVKVSRSGKSKWRSTLRARAKAAARARAKAAIRASDTRAATAPKATEQILSGLPPA